MARVLADGKTKFTVLTTAPADPAAPTATELNAGIDLSCDILSSDFTWTPTASDTVDEKALCATGNSTVFGSSNYDLGVTLWRQFDPTTGAPDTASEPGWAALKEKGVHYLDIGTSGGVWGLERGYCLMIGGEAAPVERLAPILMTAMSDWESVPTSVAVYCVPSGVLTLMLFAPLMTWLLVTM